MSWLGFGYANNQDELKKEIGQLNESVEKLGTQITMLHQLLQNKGQLNHPISSDLNPKESKSTARFFPCYKNAIAGAVALPTAFAFTHPLDTLKTRLQATLGNSKPNIPPYSQGYMAHLKDVLKRPGAGFWPSVIGAAPQGGIRLGMYGYTQKKIHPYFHSPILQNAVAAVVGDFFSSAVKVPREVIVQRLQTGMYKNTYEAIKDIIKKEGARGFFAGYMSTQLRDFPFMVVLFVSYEQFKLWKVRFTTQDQRCNNRKNMRDRKWSDAETILWGGISGALAGFTTSPIDVIKTRIMTQELAQRQIITEAFNGILKESGIRGLFRGSGARSVWWFCVCSVFFASFERIRANIPNLHEEQDRFARV